MLGSATNMMVSTLPMMVNTLVGLLSCFLIHLLLLPEPGQQVCITKRRDYPTIGAGMIRDRGQDRAGKKRSGGDKRLGLARLAGEV